MHPVIPQLSALLDSIGQTMDVEACIVIVVANGEPYAITNGLTPKQSSSLLGTLSGNFAKTAIREMN